MATAMAVSVLKADSLSIVEDPAGHRQAHPQSSKGYAINCNQELFLQLIKRLFHFCRIFCFKMIVFM
jgi:hypothetical protein